MREPRWFRMFRAQLSATGWLMLGACATACVALAWMRVPL